MTMSDGSSYQFTVQNGSDGATGPAGTDGVSPTVSVSQISGGHQVSITDATGSKVFDVMDGQNGATGPAGADGAAATIESVSAVTGEPGTQASVVNNGTPSAAELVFTLPAGADGAQGPAGPAGADGQSAYEAAQAGGYTGSESQFNTDLAGVSSKQRVVDFTNLSVTGPGSNFMYTILLTSEDKQKLFSDENPPILLFSPDKETIIPFFASSYIMEQQLFMGFSAMPYSKNAEGPFGFAVTTCSLSDDTLYINANPEFFVGRNLAIFNVPIQLPADPTEAMEAVTKQYVDNLVGTINTTLDTINGEVV